MYLAGKKVKSRIPQIPDKKQVDNRDFPDFYLCVGVSLSKIFEASQCVFLGSFVKKKNLNFRAHCFDGIFFFRAKVFARRVNRYFKMKRRRRMILVKVLHSLNILDLHCTPL